MHSRCNRNLKEEVLAIEAILISVVGEDREVEVTSQAKEARIMVTRVTVAMRTTPREVVIIIIIGRV